MILDSLIEEARLSHAGLAKRVNAAGVALKLRYDHASVARWIRDHAIPRHPVPELICEILGSRLGRALTPTDLGLSRSSSADLTLRRVVDQAAALWRGDVRSPTFLNEQPVDGPLAVAPLFEWENPPADLDISHSGRRTVGAADISQLLAARQRYVMMYRRVGGIPVRPRLTAYLATNARPLLDGSYSDSVGRALFRNVGGIVAFAGVCAYDANRQALAQQYFFHALRMAKASGDRAFGGYVVALLTNQAIHLGRVRLAIQYAETAIRACAGELTPGLRLDLHAMQAKAYARMGDKSGCFAKMKLAEADASALDPAREPPEMTYVQPGLIEVQHAEALRQIGDLRAAHGYATGAVEAAGDAHLRGQVHRLATLALVEVAAGEVDLALATAHSAFDRAGGMESWRIRDRLTTVADSLRPYAKTKSADAPAFFELADAMLKLAM